jgi:hypothetical protein
MVSDREIPTLTVIGSRPLARADGRVAILLDTRESGAIAFEVNLQTIEILRGELAKAELLLRQGSGNA